MHKLGVIVPYRNRWEQLVKFEQVIEPYLKERGIDYKLIIVEQDNASSFNRGMLCNIGFKEATKHRCDYVVFHDVDMLPKNIDYSYSDTPIHLATDELPFDTYFGGITLFPSNLFRKIDGFSNMYWGWGFEDDDLRYRCIKNDIEFKSKVNNNYQYTDSTVIFNGIDSYIKIPNSINYLRDFTLNIDLRLDNLNYDHEKTSDVFPIFNVEGYDFALNYSSFRRFVVQCFDIKGKYYQIYSKPNHLTTAQITVKYSSFEKEITFIVNGKEVGTIKLENKIRNYKKVESIFIGADNKLENFFKGAIDRFSIQDANNDYICKYYSGNSNGLEEENKYFWKDLTGNKNTGEFTNIHCSVFETREAKDGHIPFRRTSKIGYLKHDNNGFDGGRWISDLTRWNQLRYNNEVLNGVYDDTKDGLSTLKYLVQGRLKKNKDIIHLNVGI